ncbi:hypothetical protein GGI21_005445, partial [Coemansia aciculifera]
SGDSVSVLFDEDQAHSAVITGFRDIKPTSRQTSVTRLIARNPWKSIVVEWSGGSEVGAEQVSPWELVHDDDDAAAEIPADTKESLLDIVDTLRDVANFEWFVRNVDYVVDYPDYLMHVAYPMCLDTIYERLDNGYYRHPSAVAFDLALIKENADAFNDPGTLVPIAAKKLVVQYAQQAGRVLGTAGGETAESNDDAGHDGPYDPAMSSPMARRRSTRNSSLSNGHHRAVAAAAAASASTTRRAALPAAADVRQSRKRKPQAAATSSNHRVSRRRVDSRSDESDFVDQDSDDDDGDTGSRRPRRGKRSAHYKDEEEESEGDNGYSGNDDDDDDDDLYS